MERRLITIPRSLFSVTVTDWHIDWRGQSVSGGQGDLNGTDQVVFSAAPRFVGSPQIALAGADIRQWRAVMSALRGRTNIFRVPMVDMPELPWDRARRAFLASARPGALEPLTYAPTVTLVSDAPAGAESIVVDESNAPAPVQVGQFMSHDDWPFVVTSRQESETTTTLTVEMPLRKAISAGSLIEMEAFGRFETVDDAPATPEVDTTRTAIVQLNLREYLNR